MEVERWLVCAWDCDCREMTSFSEIELRRAILRCSSRGRRASRSRMIAEFRAMEIVMRCEAMMLKWRRVARRVLLAKRYGKAVRRIWSFNNF